jgi:hypothetical protein
MVVSTTANRKIFPRRGLPASSSGMFDLMTTPFMAQRATTPTNGSVIRIL